MWRYVTCAAFAWALASAQTCLPVRSTEAGDSVTVVFDDLPVDEAVILTVTMQSLDLGGFDEFVDIFIDGQLEARCGSNRDCLLSRLLCLTTSVQADEDGEVEVRLDASSAVGPICGTGLSINAEVCVLTDEDGDGSGEDAGTETLVLGFLLALAFISCFPVLCFLVQTLRAKGGDRRRDGRNRVDEITTVEGSEVGEDGIEVAYAGVANFQAAPAVRIPMGYVVTSVKIPSALAVSTVPAVHASTATVNGYEEGAQQLVPSSPAEEEEDDSRV